ncbi:MAG: hypothetical protein H6728_03910 [Myxococcales bacterium]|nr:hypothetical protein [Myxococcales bacterium]
MAMDATRTSQTRGPSIPYQTSEEREFEKHFNVMKTNAARFDNGAFCAVWDINDGKISRGDLEALVNNPFAPENVKEAAKLLPKQCGGLDKVGWRRRKKRKVRRIQRHWSDG